MRTLTFLFVFLFSLSGLFGQIPDGYYDAAAGKTGSELKTALHNIIKGNVFYPYSSSSTDVWDILKETDRDPNNPDNVILIYSGLSVNAAQEYNNGNGWTREHVWAKSRGELSTTSPGPGTDVHNLKPANPTMNSLRSNRWFAECSDPVYLNGVFTGCYYSTTDWLWKPRDQVKGDVARIIFYMAVRYEGDNGEPDLEVIDSIPSDKHTTLPIHAKLSDLLKWNREDPPDDFERHRNDVIYSYQHNRNPFIDHPEYADMIWGNNTGGSAPSDPTNLTLTQGNTSLDLAWSDVSNETGYYVFRSTDANYFYPIDTLAANITTYSDASVSAGQTYYYYVKAFNSAGVSNASNMVSGQLPTQNYASELFFSEYVEGSSYNKALEVSNFTGHDIDLSQYTIRKQTNGSGDWSSGLQLSGILHHGESFVIAHSSASQTVLDKADMTTGASEMTFNGNDAISLWKNGTLIDIIGTFNDGSYFAKDVTKIRNADVASPNTTYTPSEWTDYPQDYFDNLGTHTFNGSVSQPTPTYCQPSGYTYYEWIDYVSLADMSNYSGASSDGYEDNTDMVAHLTPGQSYKFYFRPAFRNRIYTEYWSVWIDFNKDGDFEDSDELLAQGYTTDDYTYYMYLDIPSYASGTTRLRVMMSDNGYDSPCYSPRYGEIEDYTVDFSGAKNNEIKTSAIAANIGMPHINLVYPNPAHSKLFIGLNDKNITVKITTLSGRILINQKLQNNSLNISKLNPGIYMIEINDGEKAYFSKLIVR